MLKRCLLPLLLCYFLFSVPALAAAEDVSLLMLEASQKAVEQKYEEAVALYTQAIQKVPTRADAYLQRAFIYREMNRVGPMQADAIIAIKLADFNIAGGDPSATNYHTRGSGYRLLKRFPEARADLEMALRLKKNGTWQLDLQALALEEKMK